MWLPPSVPHFLYSLKGNNSFSLLLFSPPPLPFHCKCIVFQVQLPSKAQRQFKILPFPYVFYVHILWHTSYEQSMVGRNNALVFITLYLSALLTWNRKKCFPLPIVLIGQLFCLTFMIELNWTDLCRWRVYFRYLLTMHRNHKNLKEIFLDQIHSIKAISLSSYKGEEINS